MLSLAIFSSPRPVTSVALLDFFEKVSLRPLGTSPTKKESSRTSPTRLETSVTRSGQKIASLVLEGTARLELVRTLSDSTSLLLWREGEISIARKFTVGSQTYIAADFESDLPRATGLARTAKDYGSPEVLVSAISDIFVSLAGVNRGDADLATFFAIATHFVDCQDPSLRGVVGAADDWDAARFLQLVACFCRHAIPTAVFNKSQLGWLPRGFSPTFLIFDPAPPNSLNAFLDATQHRGSLVSDGERTTSFPFSSVIRDADRGLLDGAPISFCRMDATPRSRPSLVDATTLRNVQDEFQARLLFYRLMNWSQVAAEMFDPVELGGSTRALGSVLGSCFPQNRALQARVMELLKPQDEGQKFDSACGEAATVLEALLVLCHEQKTEAHVGEITTIANGILRDRGDGYQLVARRVGSLLKPFRLGHVRDSKGYKFLLSAANKRKIHELARYYDVSFFKGEITACDFC